MAFVEWMMGFPPGWVDGLGRGAALRCLGNAVMPQQGELALTYLSRGALSDADATAISGRYGPELPR